MTSIYHIPLSFSSPVNTALLNTIFSSLDSGISGLDTRLDALELFPTGSSAWTQLNLGAPGALTIAGGAITVSKTRHVIDTESAAATDDLDTITGAEGDLVILQTTSAARVVTVRHNVGNIFLADGTDRVLNDPRSLLVLVYDSTNARWCEHKSAGSIGLVTPIISTPVYAGILEVPAYATPSTGRYRVSMLPSSLDKRMVRYVASVGGILGDMIAAPTTAGTPSASNDALSTWTNFLTGGVSGNPGGFLSAFTHTRRAHNPVYEAVIQTGAAGDITSIRFFMGLFSTTPAAADDPSASGIGFRYSTNVPDAGWVGLVSSGAGNVSTTASLATVAATTVYKLRCWLNDSGALAYFSINDSVPVTLATNLPAASTELGYVVRAMTATAAGKNFKFSRGAFYGN